MSNKEFKYPVCGFFRKFRWEVDNTTSGKCEELQTKVSTDGDVCSLYDALCDEETLKNYIELNRVFIEIDKRPKYYDDGYTDVFGNCYKGLALEECMDKLVDSVEKNGLWYELDVQGCHGFGYDFCFAPLVSFHLTSEEYSDLFARICNALNVYEKSHTIVRADNESFLFNFLSDETPRL